MSINKYSYADFNPFELKKGKVSTCNTVHHFRIFYYLKRASTVELISKWKEMIKRKIKNNKKKNKLIFSRKQNKLIEIRWSLSPTTSSQSKIKKDSAQVGLLKLM